jgi:tetratricopeptide (TPR) repeat protein
LFSDLIRIANDAQRSILEEAKEAYDENCKLPQDKQQYEPYFARARVWKEAGYYPEAMFDYLDGLEVIKRLKPIDGQPENAFLLYKKYFDETINTVRIALRQPFTVTQMGRKAIDTAGHHFSCGYTKFWEAENIKQNAQSKRQLYKEALQEFGYAIAHEFYVPAYWYYRGFSYKRLGDQNKAIYCFLLACEMEKGTLLEKEQDRQETRKFLDHNHRDDWTRFWGGSYHLQPEKQNNQQRNPNFLRFIADVDNADEWQQVYLAQVHTSRHLERFQGNERVWLEKIRWGGASNEELWKFCLQENNVKK